MQRLSLKQAVKHLESGQVLAYPTEAVWGLGCDPFQQHAFEKILKLKQRPIEKGVILLSESIERITPLITQLDLDIRQKVIASWQNTTPSTRATTWLLPVNDAIPPWIYGNHDRVAVRVTNHPLCQQLCQQFDGLIVSTSANPAGLEPAKTEQQINEYFNAHELETHLAVLSGNLGASQQPSRILDALTGKVIRA